MNDVLNTDKRLLEIQEWETRSRQPDLHAVFSSRWPAEELDRIDCEEQKIVYTILPDLRSLDVLDIGCGIGRLTKTLCLTAKSVVGIDISQGMLVRAQNNVTSVNSSFIKAGCSHLPFKEKSFDLILAVYVLQHVLDDNLFEKALTCLLRVIRPKGYILIIDGIGENKYKPLNSDSTIVRRIEDYKPIIYQCAIEKTMQYGILGDIYTAILWRAP